MCHGEWLEGWVSRSSSAGMSESGQPLTCGMTRRVGCAPMPYSAEARTSPVEPSVMASIQADRHKRKMHQGQHIRTVNLTPHQPSPYTKTSGRACPTPPTRTAHYIPPPSSPLADLILLERIDLPLCTPAHLKLPCTYCCLTPHLPFLSASVSASSTRSGCLPTGFCREKANLCPSILDATTVAPLSAILPCMVGDSRRRQVRGQGPEMFDLLM